MRPLELELTNRYIKKNANDGNYKQNYTRIVFLCQRFREALEYGCRILNNETAAVVREKLKKLLSDGLSLGECIIFLGIRECLIEAQLVKGLARLADLSYVYLIKTGVLNNKLISLVVFNGYDRNALLENRESDTGSTNTSILSVSSMPYRLS